MKKFDFKAEDFEAMTPEQEAQLKEALETPRESNAEAVKRGDATADYTVRRKVIYRGKMAPKGHVYIVIRMKTKTNTFEAHQLIVGGQGEVFEGMIEQQLRELIRTKYNV